MASNMIFAARIKKLRKEHRESQTVVANLTGYSKQAVSHWENNGKVPRSQVLKMLAEHYNTTTDYLFGFDLDPVKIEKKLEMSQDEVQLLLRYRMMGEDQKDTIQKVAESFVPLKKANK